MTTDVTIADFVGEAEVVISQIDPTFEYAHTDLYGFVSAAWPYDGSPADAACEFSNAVKAQALARIEAAAGDWAVSHANPCGLAAHYDVGHERPWRIADDHHSESFATADEAEAAAESWND